MTINTEILLDFIESQVNKFEKQLFILLDEINNSKKINDCNCAFEKISLIQYFLSSIYLSFNSDLRDILNQRIWEKNKIISILKDLDRIDDIESRKIFYKKIKEWYYD